MSSTEIKNYRSIETSQPLGAYSSILSNELPWIDDSGITSSGVEEDLGEEDAVSHGIRKLGGCLMRTTLLWLLSYVLIMIHEIIGYQSTSIIYRVVEFIPLWIGSLLGMIEIVILLQLVCKQGSTLISKERRIYMIAYDSNPEEYINSESLPLLRQLLFWSILLSIIYITTFATQIYSFYWLITGKIGLWRSLIPMIIMFAILLIYVTMVKSLSI